MNDSDEEQQDTHEFCESCGDCTTCDCPHYCEKCGDCAWKCMLAGTHDGEQ